MARNYLKSLQESKVWSKEIKEEIEIVRTFIQALEETTEEKTLDSGISNKGGHWLNK